MMKTIEETLEIIKRYAPLAVKKNGRIVAVGANLEDANLRNVNLTGANLMCANFRRAYLPNANLTGAYLSNANLTGANLRNTNFRRANLGNANFRRAYLPNANLTGAYLSNAIVDGTLIQSEKAVGSRRNDNIYASPVYEGGVQTGWGFHFGCFYTESVDEAKARIISEHGEGEYLASFERLLKKCEGC